MNVSTSHDEPNQQIRLVVKDEGKGIKPEELAKITEPFHTTRLDSGGTGLGMSISDTIIKNHQGVLEIDSTLGKGTTMTIILPVKENAKDT